MLRYRIVVFISTLALATPSHSVATKNAPEEAHQIALRQQYYREWLAEEPPPEAYVEPTDQERARLLGKACDRADVDHGCHLLFPLHPEMNMLERDAPCAIYHSDFITFRPFDQCYRMTQPEHFKGVWIDAFEGSRFYPGFNQRPDAHDIDLKAADAREQIERERRKSIWLNLERVDLPHGYAHGGRDGRAVMVEFVGRQTLYPGHYGHMGMSAQEIIVDKLIEAHEIK